MLGLSKTEMVTVMIESPYSAETPEKIQENVDYAIKCMQDCINRGEAPFASHLLYTQQVGNGKAFEKDGQTDQQHWITRAKGIELGSTWRKLVDKTVFYLDKGWSSGMRTAKEDCVCLGRPFEERFITTKILYVIEGSNEMLKQKIGMLLLPQDTGIILLNANLNLKDYSNYKVVIRIMKEDVRFGTRIGDNDFDGRAFHRIEVY